MYDTEKIYRGQTEKTKTLYMQVGSTLPSIEYECRDEESNVIDFTDSSISFIWKKFDTNLDAEIIQVSSGTVSDGDTTGILKYAWHENDTADDGIFFGQFLVEYSDGNIEYFPKNFGQCVVIYE